ncbi:hypothetical protein SAMN05216233_118120 [Desulfoluna spongiiphila]|uniref:Uncharacterized protein n=1 Tax=Desulfoluna spongiiphila TaxID=419481 RepID=A0A1G5IBJ9_9BACT|nr:hypothetical protein SAMN05216233_118120 [Desulfoluna spongiiphila]
MGKFFPHTGAFFYGVQDCQARQSGDFVKKCADFNLWHNF